MYVPPLFAETEPEILHRTMRELAFATLVTTGAQGLVASHVPLLLDAGAGPQGTLLGHVARANPHWREMTGEALAIFLGPNAYISPSHYPSKQAGGRVVPTWNYLAVHAYGPIEVFEDEAGLLDLVTRLTAAHEAGRANPWEVADAPADFIAGMLRAIVGFRLPIARLEGKWKMSQNRPEADRAGVVAGLTAEGGAAADVAEIVRGRNGLKA